MASANPALEDLLHSAYRYANALSSHMEMAEDLVHEGWLKVLDGYGPVPDKALLFRVIRNLYIDDFRHRQRFPSDSLDIHEIEDASDNDPTYFASEDRVLSEALSLLRDAEREVLFLWVFEGYTAAEIAKLTGLARGTILSQIHRAKAKLRDHLESNHPAPLKLVQDNKSDSA